MALAPAGGGGGGGGADVKVLSQQPAILVQSGGSVVDAVTVRALETHYGVPFQFTVSKNTWEGTGFKAYADLIAGYIFELATHPHVVYIYSAQDTDLGGYLHDYLFITVAIDGTDSTAEARIVQDGYGSDAGSKAIDAAYTKLVENQNLGG